jgi:hypothetical protein
MEVRIVASFKSSEPRTNEAARDDASLCWECRGLGFTTREARTLLARTPSAATKFDGNTLSSETTSATDHMDVVPPLVVLWHRDLACLRKQLVTASRLRLP